MKSVKHLVNHYHTLDATHFEILLKKIVIIKIFIKHYVFNYVLSKINGI